MTDFVSEGQLFEDSQPGDSQPGASNAEMSPESSQVSADSGSIQSQQSDADELLAEVKDVLDSEADRIQAGGLDVEIEEELDPVIQLQLKLDERTEDLQRLQAEYINYKKRVDRDRALARQKGVEDAVEDIIPVFDAIDQAKTIEEVSEGFLKIEQLLIKACEKNGLTSFGEAGDVFDPKVHEAMMSSPSAEVTEPTCAEIFQKGYWLDDRLLRAARVIVAMPIEESQEATDAGETKVSENPNGENSGGDGAIA